MSEEIKGNFRKSLVGTPVYFSKEGRL